MNETNWSGVNAVVTDADLRACEKAKKQEREKKQNGWDYVSINERTKVLVPCCKKGVPTKEGMAKIEKIKELLGLK